MATETMRAKSYEYKPHAKKTLEEIKNMDAGDESLEKYKKSLLCQEGCSPGDDPRVVIVKDMALVVPGRDDIVFDLSSELNGTKITLKEGVQFRMRAGFHIHHEIVSGLLYHQVMKRDDVTVEEKSYMVGSYGPKQEVQTWKSPLYEAVEGEAYRGSYNVESKFIDDDGDVHLEWQWELEIKEDWE